MKPILLNFLSIIRRYKIAVILNVMGLSVAFAAFIIIMIQLDYDYGFDKFHKNHDRIFRMEFSQKNSVQAVIPRPFADCFFDSSPHIVAGAIANPSTGKAFFHVVVNDVRIFFEEASKRVSPEYTDVFTFDFVEGPDDALKTPGNVIIPLSLSRKIFGNESAVGKLLHSEPGNQTVGAVYRDFPANTIVNNCIYIPLLENENRQNWNSWDYHVYFRVNDSSCIPFLFENFKRNFDAQAVFGQHFDWDEAGVGLRLTALPAIHFVTDVKWDQTPKASKQTLLILLTIALVVVAIATINFTNFSTALTPMRVKNINTQKVLGARRHTLRLSLITEAVIISIFSAIVAVLLVGLFHHSPLSRLVDADLSVAEHPLIVGGMALIALVTGVLAGLYPAFYMTSFAPALALKGSFGLSPKGRQLRNTLIGIQFISSFTLIIVTCFMYLQNYFMQHSPLGYEKDTLVTVNIRRIEGNRDAYTNQLKAFSGIEDVTYSEYLLSSSDSYMGWRRGYNGDQISFNCLPVNHTFLTVMGIEVAEGRDFRREDMNTQHGAYIFNKTAQKMYGLELNEKIDNQGDIIGFIPDVKFASFRKSVEPMAFYVRGNGQLGHPPNFASIKVKAGADVRAAIAHIRLTLSAYDSEYPLEIRFFDEVLQRLYEKETMLGTLISLFSLLAIFISITGVFGLVVFDSECRRKEIGIRKILGASIAGIIIMFNKVYMKLLLICFALAAPLARYGVSRWLSNFAYKTPMYWWVYLLAFAGVVIITASTVTFQNWRVANDNPVKSIKSD